MQTIGKAWRAVRDRFADAGLGTPELDARLLAAEAFGFDAGRLAFHEGEAVLPGPAMRLEELAGRRIGGEPVARILGRKEFYGLDFGLNRATLVPRPETELLVDLGLKALKSKQSPRILDLGTGSGCIAVAMAATLTDSLCVATDRDDEALEQAVVNASRHGVNKRIAFRHGDWFGRVAEKERFDLIVSNPPYIESGALDGLAREVREHDPLAALDGGADGLDPYRIIAARAMEFLAPGGTVVVEVGAGQAPAVAGLFADGGFGETEVHPDLAGIGRAVVART